MTVGERMWMGTALAASVVLTSSACGPLRPRSDAWVVETGSASVRKFQPGFVPPSQFYFVYAASDPPERVYVSPSPRNDAGVSYSWAPSGLPMGRYVFAIDPNADAADHLPWDDFMALEVEPPPPPAENRWLAVLSFDDSVHLRREVGVPSVIPFMGRKHWVERVEYHRGTAYLEVYQGEEATGLPAIRLSKQYENWRYLPELAELGGWAASPGRPTLVIVDAADPTRPPEILTLTLRSEK